MCTQADTTASPQLIASECVCHEFWESGARDWLDEQNEEQVSVSVARWDLERYHINLDSIDPADIEIYRIARELREEAARK